MRKRGRPVLLGEKMDVTVQEYVEMMRNKGGTISTVIVMSGARNKFVRIWRPCETVYIIGN